MANRGLFGVFLALCLTVSIGASWPTDPTVNVPLCTADGNQGGNGIIVVPSINGGAIVAWKDERVADADIYAQKVDGFGAVQWAVDGVPACTAAGLQMNVKGISDGVGGAILVWIDMRNGESDLYAQRLDVDGNPMWPVGSPSMDGVPVCNTAGSQSHLLVVSDGAGGAIVAWQLGSTPSDLFAQRLNLNGEIQWPVGSPAQDGVAVSTADGVQTSPQMIEDGVGGAILAWTDGRDSPTTSFDIYAQRVSAAGETVWPVDVPVCVAHRAQTYPVVTGDGSGGAFIAWEDARDSSADAIFAQHLDSLGVAQWVAGGLMLNDTTVDGQVNLRGVADGQGGAVLVWKDIRNYATTGFDLYAQRVVSGGAVWATGGIIICAATGDQTDPAVGSPVAGSVVFSWTDARTGVASSDIYAQKIVDGLTTVGPPDGLAVSTADYSQQSSVVGRTGWSEAMIVWRDPRNLASGLDIYSQGVFLSVIFVDGFESGDTSKWSTVVP